MQRNTFECPIFDPSSRRTASPSSARRPTRLAARPADAAADRARLSTAAIYPVTRSQSEVLGHAGLSRRSPTFPEAADLAVILVPAAHVVATIEQCGARGIRAAVVISSGFRRGEERGGARRATSSCARSPSAPAWSSAGPNSEGLVNPLRPLVATFSPVFHDPTVPLLPAGEHAPGRSRSAASSGALTFAFLQPRPRPAAALHLSGQRRQPDRARSARLCRLGARRRRRRHLPVLSRRHPRPGPLPRRRRQGGARRQAADRRQGRALRRRAARRRLAYRRAGACRRWPTTRSSAITASSAARTSTTWSMSRPPSPICRLPRGNRVAVITGSGGSAVWMADILSAHGLELPVLEDDIQQRADGAAAVLRLGAKPGRRAPRRRSARSATRRLVELVRAVEADRHDPADRLAGQRSDRAKKRADELARDHRRRPSKPILLSTYTTAIAGGDGDASPRPASPATPRCRAAPARSARWSITPRSSERVASRAEPASRPRRACATRSAARWPRAGPVLTEARAEGAARPLRRAACRPKRWQRARTRRSRRPRGSAAPVALKVQSPDILHKTEAGAVALGARRRGGGARGLPRGAGAARRRRTRTLAIDGVLVQAMAPPRPSR